MLVTTAAAADFTVLQEAESLLSRQIADFVAGVQAQERQHASLPSTGQFLPSWHIAAASHTLGCSFAVLHSSYTKRPEASFQTINILWNMKALQVHMMAATGWKPATEAVLSTLHRPTSHSQCIDTLGTLLYIISCLAS